MPIQQAQFTESIHKMQLRLPASLHRRLEAEAGRRQMSMNALIVEVLDTALPHPKEVAMMMDIQAVLERFGDWAHGGQPADVAREWAQAGFSAPQVERWLEAECYDAAAARALADAGISPEVAATVLDETYGEGGYRGTIGRKVSNGDLSVEHLRKMVFDTVADAYWEARENGMEHADARYVARDAAERLGARIVDGHPVPGALTVYLGDCSLGYIGSPRAIPNGREFHG